MGYGGLNKKKNAVAEFVPNPVSKYQIQPSMEEEQADAGRDD